MSLFTPINGLFGGSLIGLSAATLLLFNGDIMGASGIISSFINSPQKTLTDPSQQWKVSFMAAFLVSAKLYLTYIEPDALHDHRLAFDSNLPIVSKLGYAVAGFLVGVGTKLSNGCTSGHGICGLARLSRRSFAAVGSFMATGFLAATVCSPTCPLAKYLRTGSEALQLHYPSATTAFIGSIVTSIAVGAAIPAILKPMPKPDTEKDTTKDALINNQRKLGPAAVSGALFSVGLAISRMTKSSKIYGFLDLQGLGRGTYDPTLMCVMGGGVIVSWISYQYVQGHNCINNPKLLSCPLGQKESCGKFNVPTNKVIDSNLVFGAAIFGLGWGIGGLCPGPALFLACAGFPNLLYYWWPSFFAGTWIAQKFKDFQTHTLK